MGRHSVLIPAVELCFCAEGARRRDRGQKLRDALQPAGLGMDAPAQLSIGQGRAFAERARGRRCAAFVSVTARQRLFARRNAEAYTTSQAADVWRSQYVESLWILLSRGARRLRRGGLPAGARSWLLGA